MKELKVLFLLWKNRSFIREVSVWMDKTRMDRALTMETVLTDRHKRGMQELQMLDGVLRNDPKLIKNHLEELRVEFQALKKMELGQTNV
jgi:hypothetical protein